MGPATPERPSAEGAAGGQRPIDNEDTEVQMGSVNRLQDKGGGRAGRVLQAFLLCPRESAHWS